MNTSESKIQLWELLSALPNVDVKTNYDLSTRCVLCGDSKKDPNKKRLYIKIDPSNDDEPILYHCFNCNQSGVVHSDMIEAIVSDGGLGGITAKSIASTVKKINRSSSENSGSLKVNRYRRLVTIPVRFPEWNMKSDEKMERMWYIFHRIGKSFDIKDHSHKIIWSLFDFLQENGFEPHGRQDNLITLDRDYVGFLSVHNDFIMMRDTTGKHKYRWVKYNILNQHSQSGSYYAMSNQIDVLSRDDIHLIVAEGPLDILSIRYNLYDNRMNNFIYLACCNGSFTEPILYYINKGLVGKNVKIDIYIDSDTRYDFHQLLQQLKPFKVEVQLWQNMKQKDFGYPLEELDPQPWIPPKRLKEKWA